YRLQKVVERAHLKRLQRVLIICRSKDHQGNPFELCQKIKRSPTWHLDVEKYQRRMQCMDSLAGLSGVARLANDIHTIEGRQQAPYLAARQRLVVDDERLHAGIRTTA